MISIRKFLPRFVKAIEPDYDWGRIGWERLDGEGEGPAHRFEIEWLGLKLLFAIGRRPKRHWAAYPQK